MKEFESVKDIVENVMSKDVRVRNSDMWLYLRVWQEMGFKVYIPYDKINEIPKPETISRVRRKLNEEGKYLPTSQEVRRKRKIKQDKVRDWSINY